jgi:hypothetical protein
VNDGIVPNVGARADNYPIDIASQNSAVPYARFFHQRYVADDGCAGDDVGGGMNARAKFQPGVDAGMTETGLDLGKCITSWAQRDPSIRAGLAFSLWMTSLFLVRTSS